jgi:hypothetical protein
MCLGLNAKRFKLSKSVVFDAMPKRVAKLNANRHIGAANLKSVLPSRYCPPMQGDHQRGDRP